VSRYKEITPGTGKTPLVSTPCKCHYAGTLIDGTEFDSSYKRGAPLTFAPNQVIKGWTEAMQLMKEGGKWELYIPSELGYGDRGAGAFVAPTPPWRGISTTRMGSSTSSPPSCLSPCW